MRPRSNVFAFARIFSRNSFTFTRYALDGGVWPAVDRAGILAAQFALLAFAAPVPLRWLKKWKEKCHKAFSTKPRRPRGCQISTSRLFEPFTRRRRRTHCNHPASGAFLRGIWPFPGGHKSVSILDALRSGGLEALARRLRGKASIQELRSPAGCGGVCRA